MNACWAVRSSVFTAHSSSSSWSIMRGSPFLMVVLMLGRDRISAIVFSITDWQSPLSISLFCWMFEFVIVHGIFV